jgi:hemoglobin
MTKLSHLDPLRKFGCVAALSLLLSAGCTSQAAPDQLYQDLGQLEGITEVADGFLYYLSQDERVIDFFAETDIERFHEKVIEHICDLSGGPCDYSGDDMVSTHKGMAINETQFNAVVEDLILAMDDAGVPTRTQNRLLRVLASLHGDIVGI